MTEQEHISICILTFKRAELLHRLLKTLEEQKTGNVLGISVIVVDNDVNESARPVVASARVRGKLPIEYHLEPVQNLALARNRAMSAATGDYLAFIDDDEFPADDWLLNLVRACRQFQTDGVLGPVVPHFEQTPPDWILKGRMFDRPRYPTGTILHWNQTRTGNTLLRRNLFADSSNRFDPAFGVHGEDRDFFRRMMDKGYKFIWCDTAIAYETQPPERLRRRYFVRRALLRGSVAYAHTRSKYREAAKSVVALCFYTLALPALQLAGHHWFMKFFIKTCDHTGRLLAAFGWPVEKRMKQI